MTKKKTSRQRVRRPYPRRITRSGGESMTEQAHARSCDINTIMSRYEKTGVLEHIKDYEPQFGDVSDLDFKRAMDTVAQVKSEFQDLPAWVRDHYNQDEGKYLEAVSTEDGVAELRALTPPSQAYTRDGERDVEVLAESAPQISEKEASGTDEATQEGVT